MSNIANLRTAIKHAETQLKYSEEVLELTQHPLFSKLIIEGYITQNTEDLLANRVDPNKQSPEALAANLRGLDAVAVFKGWLNEQFIAGDKAERALEQLNEELDLAIENGETE